jgi:hypothetical protein
MSPARHWLPAQPVSDRDLLLQPSPFLRKRHLEENRNAWRTAFSGPFT